MASAFKAFFGGGKSKTPDPAKLEADRKKKAEEAKSAAINRLQSGAGFRSTILTRLGTGQKTKTGQ